MNTKSVLLLVKPVAEFFYEKNSGMKSNLKTQGAFLRGTATGFQLMPEAHLLSPELRGTQFDVH